MRDCTTIADLELPLPELLESARTARRRLAPLLACRNGSTAATMHSFGHGHLDVAWLWPLAGTRRQIAHTMANQLALGYDREIAQVAQCWMLEEQNGELKADGNTVALAFRPFEIKTLRLRLR